MKLPAEQSPRAAIDRIIEALSIYTKTTGKLQSDDLRLIIADMNRFEETTKDLSKQMLWQGRWIFCVSALGAGLAIAGALIPAGGAPGTPEAAKNNEFLKETCKTAGMFFSSGMPSVVSSFYQSKTGPLESKRELVRTLMQNEGQDRTAYQQETNKAQERGFSIIEAKSRSA